MAEMRVLFDTNVVLDVLLRREPWVVEAQALWQAVDDGRIVGYIPAVAVTNIVYIARRQTQSLDRYMSRGVWELVIPIGW
jgi:predicted nucleic acid-binding protein